MIRVGHQCVVCHLDDMGDMMFDCPTKRITMRKTIDFSQYDIVHSHGFRPNVYIFLHRSVWGKKRKTTFVTTFHSYVFEDFKYDYGAIKGTLASWLFLLTAKRHDGIVTLSKDAVGYYKRYYNQDKLYYAYNGLRIEVNEDCVSYSKPTACVVGSYCQRHRIKGMDILRSAAELLPKEFRLQIIEDERNASRHLVEFDIFVMASFSEGFSLALLEAAMAGKNIVCADIPGMREKYSEEEVTYFKAGDAEDLARAIVYASIHDKGEKAREREKFFSAENLCKNYLRIYQNMLDK